MTTAPRPWLIGPAFDLLFVANLAWPAVAALALAGPPAYDHLLFLQMYLVTTPHRWITLAVVFLDRDQFWARPGRFAAVGAMLVGGGLALVGVSAAVFGPAEALLLLVLLDIAWNAWHFAAQHAGIARIYARLGRPDLSPAAVAFERVALRLLVLWAFARLWVYVLGSRPVDGFAWLTPGVRSLLVCLDVLAAAPALLVLGREVLGPTTAGRLAYLTSVVALYAATLVAVAAEDPAWMKAMLLTGAAFHAAEYLAVVSWSAGRRRGEVWAYLVPRLGVVVMAFMLVLMVTNALAARHALGGWTLVTLLVSLLHYGYDGMIWKSRPAPAGSVPG